MSSAAPIIYGSRRLSWRDTVSDMAVSAEDGTLLVSPPSSDPLQAHLVPDGVSPALYQVPSTGHTAKEHERAMKETENLLRQSGKLLCGFMISQNFQTDSLLSPMMSATLNNGGDPWTTRGAPFYFKPKWMERNVLDYYASLWNAKWPHNPSDPESYWGYVLTMGSTEGNMHALWAACNYLSGKDTRSMEQEVDWVSSSTSVITKPPVVLFSQNGHSSLAKLCDVVNIPTFDVVGQESYADENPLGGEWVAGVPCNGGDAGPGTVDIDALGRLVDFFSKKGHGYGTTIKGACDDVQTAGERLVSILKKNNMYHCRFIKESGHCVRRGFWFHIDGALAAAYMPFLQMAHKNGLTNITSVSVFDFRLDFVSSIVMSGHMVQKLKQLPSLRKKKSILVQTTQQLPSF